MRGHKVVQVVNRQYRSMFIYAKDSPKTIVFKNSCSPWKLSCPKLTIIRRAVHGWRETEREREGGGRRERGGEKRESDREGERARERERERELVSYCFWREREPLHKCWLERESFDSIEWCWKCSILGWKTKKSFVAVCPLIFFLIFGSVLPWFLMMLLLFHLLLPLRDRLQHSEESTFVWGPILHRLILIE